MIDALRNALKPYWVRVALVLGVIVALGGLRGFSIVDASISPEETPLVDYLAWGFSLFVLVGVLIVYRSFLKPLGRYLVAHMGQAAILLTLYALIYGLFGNSLGIPALFWNESLLARFFSADAATILLAILGVNAFYLDQNPARTNQAVRAFLAQRRLKYPWTHYLWSRGWNGFITENPRDLTAFLRLSRFPFLAALVWPVLFPSLFPNIPSNAPHLLFPDGSPIQLDWSSQLRDLDTTRSLVAWLLNVAIWCSGVIMGVVTVKVLTRLSDRHLNDIQSIDLLLAFFRRPPGALIGIAALVFTLGDSAFGWLDRTDDLHRWVSFLVGGFAFFSLAVCLDGTRSIRPDPLARQRDHGFTRFLTIVMGIDLCFTLGEVLLVHGFSLKRLDTIWNAAGPMRGGESLPLVMVLTLMLIALLGNAAAQGLLGSWRSLAGAAAMLVPTILIVVLLPAGVSVCVLLALFAVVGAWLGRLGGRMRLIGTVALIAWIAVVNTNFAKVRFPNLDYRREKLVPLGAAVARALDPPTTSNFATTSGDKRPTDDQALTRWWEGHMGVPLTPMVRSLNGQANGTAADREQLWRRAIALRTSLANVPALPRCWTLIPRQAPNLPRLTVVCVTGGASRSAYWTAVVLRRLSAEVPEFSRHVRIVTGASGGMVGAAHFVAAIGRGESTDDASWINEMEVNSFLEIARAVALHAPVEALLPLTPAPLELPDRGTVLERSWTNLRTPFAQLRDLESNGRIPSLIFSPMIVEDGRRLLISNLRVPHLAIARTPTLQYDPGSRAASTLSGLELFELFPDAAESFELATAARMAASFPYVSPAVSLPTWPPLRVVDAGYSDNFGVALAADWLFHHRRKLASICSGVAVTQIRAFMGRASRLGVPQPVESDESLSHGLEVVTTGSDALLTAYNAGSVFRNDLDLAALSEWFNAPRIRGAAGRNPPFFTTVVFENSAIVPLQSNRSGGGEPDWPSAAAARAVVAPGGGEVAMTWALTRQEMQAMDSAIPSDESAIEHHKQYPQQRVNDLRDLLIKIQDTKELDQRFRLEKILEQLLNYERIQELKTWWKRPSFSLDSAR